MILLVIPLTHQYRIIFFYLYDYYLHYLIMIINKVSQINCNIYIILIKIYCDTLYWINFIYNILLLFKYGKR